MKVELFYTPGCEKCSDGKERLRAIAQELIPNLLWRELNVLDELDYATEIGILKLPSIAIDSKVVFSSLPTPKQLHRELSKRIGKRA